MTATLPRIVELIRVSGAAQSKADTPQDQRDALDRLRESRPGVVVERIEEGANGLSGALPLSQRPDLQRLVELARAKAFDELRVRAVDRLTRADDARERFAIFGIVADAGAIVVDTKGTVIDPASEIGELQWCFGSMAAAKERRSIAERNAAGRVRHAAKGELMGRRPFGRTWSKAAGWGVVEAEVEVYARLFREVLAGRSLHAIARALNAEGLAAPGAARWTAGAVSRLIKHRGAIGQLSNQGATLACPPVVDPETFAKANAAVNGGRAGRPARLDDAAALIRGVGSCGCCASPLYVDTSAKGAERRLYYRCKHSKTATSPECRYYLAVAKVDALARTALLGWLRRDVVSRAKGPDPVKAEKAARARLAALEVEEHRILTVARGTASPAGLQRALAELASDRERARRELEAARLAAKAAPPPVELARERRAELLQRAEAATPAELRALVKAILRAGDARIFANPLRVEIRASAA